MRDVPHLPTVADLVAALQEHDQDARVFMAHDAEGNGYARVHQAAMTTDTGKTVVLWPLHENLDEELDEDAP
jgi:anti-sigma-K factor RskA